MALFSHTCTPTTWVAILALLLFISLQAPAVVGATGCSLDSGVDLDLVGADHCLTASGTGVQDESGLMQLSLRVRSLRNGSGESAPPKTHVGSLKEWSDHLVFGKVIPSVAAHLPFKTTNSTGISDGGAGMPVNTLACLLGGILAVWLFLWKASEKFGGLGSSGASEGIAVTERHVEMRWYHVLLLVQLDMMAPVTQDAYIPSMPLMAQELNTTESAVGIGGGSQALCYAVACDIIPDEEERARFNNMLSLYGSLAIVIAPVAGGLAATLMGWRMVFILLACWGMLALWNVFRLLPETGRTATRSAEDEEAPRPDEGVFGPLLGVFAKSLRPLGLIASMWMLFGALFANLSSMSAAAKRWFPWRRPCTSRAASSASSSGAGSRTASAAASAWRRCSACRSCCETCRTATLARRCWRCSMAMLDGEGFRGLYDFLYLPMDFKTQACLGYAFVNLVASSDVPRFWDTFSGYKSWVHRSKKVCCVTWSWPEQGREAHVDRYRNSPIMHSSVPEQYKPIVSEGGQRIPFPPPTKAPKLPRRAGTLAMTSG